MKLNINWKELGIQLLKAIWPVLAGALTVATATGCTSMATQPQGQNTEIIRARLTGCTSMATQPRGQTTEIIACGIPAIAWISHSAQLAENYGGDTNAPTNAIKQVVPVTTVIGK